MSRPKRNLRRGFTLIETVLVISGVSIVLGLCGGLLHVMLRLDRSGHSQATATMTVARLARQFRQDVHAGLKAEPGGNRDGIALTLSDGRIVEYQAREQVLTRTEHRGATVERSEAFVLSSSSGPRFEVDQKDGSSWVRLILPRRAEHESGLASRRTGLSIDAVVARDARWLNPEAQP